MKKYKDLSLNTKKALESKLRMLHKHHLTVAKAKRMTDKELAKAINFKGKDISSTRRVIKQISTSQERREGSIKLAKKFYISKGFTGRGLTKMEQDLTKVSGNLFSAISDDLQDKLGLSEKESYKKARELLTVPIELESVLTPTERDILDDYDYRAL